MIAFAKPGSSSDSDFNPREPRRHARRSLLLPPRWHLAVRPPPNALEGRRESPHFDTPTFGVMLRRMATHSLRLRYRPIRFGWCIREGNFDDLRRVIRLSNTLWGGRYNPIIRVGEPKGATELVELYRVDALYPATEDPILTAFIDRFPYLQWPTWDKGFFIGEGDGRALSTFLDIYHPARNIFQEHIR